MSDTRYVKRDLSERTKRNFFYARSHRFIGPGHTIIEVNLWCEEFTLFPKRVHSYDVTWWELEHIANTKVNIRRYYWLKFGLAVITPTF